jgi:hypothetical protein
MFLILADFLSALEGREGVTDGEGSVHCRPGRYSKESSVGPQGGSPGQTGTASSS